jgi:hypothetical protein
LFRAIILLAKRLLGSLRPGARASSITFRRELNRRRYFPTQNQPQELISTRKLKASGNKIALLLRRHSSTHPSPERLPRSNQIDATMFYDGHNDSNGEQS